MTAHVKLEKGMRFEAEAGSGYHVTLDAAEQSGGHLEGFLSMEMLLLNASKMIVRRDHLKTGVRSVATFSPVAPVRLRKATQFSRLSKPV